MLDDDMSCSMDERFREYVGSNVVQTDPAVGLTASNAEEAIAILRRPDDRPVPHCSPREATTDDLLRYIYS